MWFGPTFFFNQILIIYFIENKLIFFMTVKETINNPSKLLEIRGLA
jgi:hypothetical protein